jgi:hypothetical protein
MNIEKDIPIPKNIRGRKTKYQFQAMEIGHSFFTAGDSRIQRSILTSAKKHLPKRFITQMAVVKRKKGYRCWRVE